MDNDPVTIRWTDDWRAYGSVHATAYRDAYRDIMDAAYLNEFTLERREIHYGSLAALGTTAILSVDGRDAGCMALGACVDPDLANGRTLGELDAIYLLPQYRGSGYGKRMLSWALARFEEQGRGYAILWVLERNTPAIAFYARCGFEQDGAARTIERGQKYVQIRMRMELDGERGM